MKYYSLFVLILIVTLLSCKSYVQLYDTNSNNVKIQNDRYVFENDSIKISYDFWSEKGIVAFKIYNKLDKPVYIDWKKSSYIDNSNKLNYWIDEEKKRSLQYFGSYFYEGSLYNSDLVEGRMIGASASATSAFRPERITFIPPKSNYYRSQFYIAPSDYYEMDKNSKFKTTPSKVEPNKQIKVYEQSFDIMNTPLMFRNYLTFSLNEDFEESFDVDNGFYITKVREMEDKHFYYYKKDPTRKGNFYINDEMGRPIKFSEYKDSKCFYIFIPKQKSVHR